MGRDKRNSARPSRQSASRAGFLHYAWIAPTVLGIITALVYARSLAVPIHDSDDYLYYFRDARLEHLSPHQFWLILTQPFFATYHPITTLTFAFDRAVWGTWVPGFHITQILFYIGGILGVYFLFLRILDWRAGAFLASAIYATHTVHVESVAWLASRKDVVCLFFYAFTLLAYAHYSSSSKGRWGPYTLSVALAAAAMLSKGYAIILPAVLFTYDLCFADRITRRHVVDKVPFLALTAAASLLTVFSQERGGGLVHVALAGGERAWRLAEILARYASHTLLPVHLSAFYAFGLTPVVGSIALLGIVLAIALPAAFVLLRRRLPAAAFGIGLFLLPLATVMNLVFTLHVWMADRFLFFPTIGSSLALAALAAPIYRRRRTTSGEARIRSMRLAVVIAISLTIGLYAALTVARIGVWTSGIRLWSDVLRKQLDLRGTGPLTAAELERSPNRQVVDSAPLISLMRAYEAAGDRAESHRIEGLLGQGTRGEEGIDEMTLARDDIEAGRWSRAARRLKPIAEGKTWSAPQALVWLSVAEDRMGNAGSSRRLLAQAIERYHQTGRPSTDALLDVGVIEFRKGNLPKATEWFQLAHKESPREAKAAFFLGRALEESGKLQDALSLYTKIAQGDLTILPQSQFTIGDVYLEMAVTLERLGRRKEALGAFEEVLRREPTHPKREAIRARIAALQAAPSP